MLPKLGRLFLVGVLLLAVVATDSLARSQRPHRVQRPRRIRCNLQYSKPSKASFGKHRERRPHRPHSSAPCEASQNLTQNLQETTLSLDSLSSNLTQTFSADALNKAVWKSAEEFGRITKVSAVDGLKILENGEWMTQEVQLTTDKGITQTFLVVFHREGGEWKLFGTLPL